MFGQGFDSPQLHQRFEPRLKAIQKTGSTAQVPLPFSLARPLPRSPLRFADGHRNRDAIVPRYLHISPSPIGNRYSVADSVRSLQLPSAPPALRADARAARYESISPYPIGARYSVLASLVLTAQKVVDCIKKKPVKADFFCLSVIARCRRARRTWCRLPRRLSVCRSCSRCLWST